MAPGVLYVSPYQDSDSNFFVTVETLITLYVFRVADPQHLDFVIKLQSKKPDEPLVKVDLTDITYKSLTAVPGLTLNCVWPVVVKGRHIIAGLCSVVRYLVKSSDKKCARNLLGFREACLMACSESSVWTRFCEVDIISTVKKLIGSRETDLSSLPEDVARFEFHMSKPVRMHNVYKVAREKYKDRDIKSNVPVTELNLEHTFGEGTCMTLADVILYPCIKIYLDKCPIELVKEKIPLTINWFNTMNSSDLPKLNFRLDKTKTNKTEIVMPNFVKQSLYTADPTRYKPQKRIFTKQNDIDNALKSVCNLKYEIVNKILSFGHEFPFDWSNVPTEATPNGGALPKKRAGRKCEQLESITKAVLKLSHGKLYKIVDFCSGSGHLGILLAVLLPCCEVILVENKEQSLIRARERIDKLKLQNVTIVQSNLDYFCGQFDVGVSLHACGVATDLVIQICIENKAHFVSCPCCYGGVKDCHSVTYPRSKQFQKLSLGYSNYLSLAHAADQTHDISNVKTNQGYFCMDVIDTDRKLYAESCGYEVQLGKLQPTSCTNKNNLLVGLCKEKT